MAAMVTAIDEVAVLWAGAMWAAVWQSTILAAFVLILTQALRRASSALRFWLWMLVPLRLLVMPLLVIPLPLLPAPEQAPIEAPQAAMLESAPEYPAIVPTAEAMDVNVLPHSSAVASAYIDDTTPKPPAATWPRPLTWLMAAWTMGLLLSALRLARCCRKVSRILARSETVHDESMLAAVQRAAALAGVNRAPRVVLTQETVSPFTCGILRPVVVIPAAFLQTVDRGGLLAVLTHEFVHLRRYDLPLGLLLALCDILYFFHPVVHAVRRMALRERERACDEAVLASSREKPSTYAKALVGAADVCRKLQCSRPSPAVATESFSDLRVRLLAIAADLNPASGLSMKGLTLIVILALLCVPGVSLTTRKADDSVSEPPATLAATQLPTTERAEVTSHERSEPVPSTGRAAGVRAARSPQIESRLGVVATTTTSDVAANERVIHFPADRSMGTVRVLYPGTSRSDYPFPWYNRDELDWVYLAEAKGDVAVPRNRPVRLDVSTSAALDLSPLADLRPDDLHMLSMHGEAIDDLSMAHIEGLTGLRRLTLNNTEVTDKGLAYVMDLTKLERLILPAGITSEGLAMLTPLRSLEELVLRRTELDGIGASLIGELGALEFLTLHHCDLSRTDLFALARLRNLKTLFCAACDMGDYHLKQVSDIASLKVLDLRGSKITNAGVRYLQPLQGLESLNLGDTAVTDTGLAFLKQFPRLEKLNLSNTRMTDEGARHLSEIETLEYFYGPYEGITDIGLGYLSRLSNLKYLWVCNSSNSPVTDAGLLQLARLPSLEVLAIGGAGITDTGLGHLAQSPSLVNLHLNFTGPITNDGVSQLTALTTLQDIGLSFPQDCLVTVAGINHLNALTDLRKISLRQIVQDGTGLDLSNLTRLEWFIANFVDGPGRDATPSLRDEDVAWVSNAPDLKWLMPGQGVNFSDTGMAHVAGLKKLERLNIGGDLVSNNGLSYIAGMPALQDLSVWGKITSPGLRHLEGLPRLRILNVYTHHTFTDAATNRLTASLPNLARFNAPTSGRARGR